jgi:hypothetical protein
MPRGELRLRPHNEEGGEPRSRGVWVEVRSTASTRTIKRYQRETIVYCFDSNGGVVLHTYEELIAFGCVRASTHGAIAGAREGAAGAREGAGVVRAAAHIVALVRVHVVDFFYLFFLSFGDA